MPTTLRKGGWTSTQRKNLSAIRYPHASDPGDFVLTREAAWEALVATGAAEGEAPAKLEVATELARLQRLFGYNSATNYHDDVAKALLGFWVGTDPAFTLALMAPEGDVAGQSGRDYLDGGEWRVWPAFKRYLFALDEATFAALQKVADPAWRRLVKSKDYNEQKRGRWLLYAFSRDSSWAHEYAGEQKQKGYLDDVVFASLTDPALALEHAEHASVTLVKWWVLDVVENLGRAAAPVLEKLAARARRADERKVVESALKIALKLEEPGEAATEKAPKKKAAPSLGALALPACLTDPFAAPKAAAKKAPKPAAQAPVPAGPPEVLTVTAPEAVRASWSAEEAARKYEDDAAVLSQIEQHLREPKLYLWYGLRELDRLSAPARLTWAGNLSPELRATVMRDRNGLAPDRFLSLFVPQGEQTHPALVIELALLAPAERFLALAEAICSPGMVRRAAELAAAKKGAEAAKDWLKAHAPVAIEALVPATAAARGKAREPLVAALELLRAAGHGAAIDAAAQGADVSAGPAEGPRAPRHLPPFFALAKLPPLELLAGGQVPAPVVDRIGELLAVSAVDSPMEGLRALVELTTPASREAFAWALLEAWLSTGAPAKDRWPVEWLGYLAGDAVCERLAALCLEWVRAGQHQRGFWAVDVLRRLGTPRAARALVQLEDDSPFQGLEGRCEDALGALAAARGLSQDELRDELVPDLGIRLGEPLVVSYGERTFELLLRAGLRLVVRDADGERDDLPKPHQGEDAAQARATFSAIKAGLKRQARDAGRRFERAMTGGRRWTAERFQKTLLDQPVLASFAQVLVWGIYEGGALKTAFRIDEARRPASLEDTEFALPPGATVGLVHPVELGETLARWSALFADYTIVQPFDQLGRAVTDAAGLARECAAVRGCAVSTGKLRGLHRRGWLRGPAGDNGTVDTMLREVTRRDGTWLQVALPFRPGFSIGAVEHDELQQLEAIDAPADLSPLSTSELALDLRLLRGA